MKGCAIDGCERRSVARGLCNMHSRRMVRTGDPLKGGRDEIRKVPEAAIRMVRDPGLRRGGVALIARQFNVTIPALVKARQYITYKDVT